MTARAEEVLIAYTVVIAACLAFWAILGMALIRVLDALSVISW